MSLVNGKRQAAWFDADPEVETEGPFAGVVFNRPIDQVFTYRVPARLRGVVRPGQRVRVPLGRGNQPAVGYCVRVDAAPPEGVAPGRVKDLLEVLDDPPLIDAAMLELTRWMAGYYACSWGQALDAVVPAGVKKQAGTRVGTFLTVPEEVRRARESLELPAKQAEALAILCRSDEPLTLSDLCRMAQCAPGPIAALRQRGYVHTVKRRVRRGPAPSMVGEPAPTPRNRARADRRAGGGARAARPRPPGRRLRHVPDPRRHRQRQDRGLPQRHRAGRGAGARGDRAGPRDQPDAADDPAVPPPVRPGRRPPQPPQRRRAAPPLAEHRLGRGPGRRRRALGGLRAGAAARPDRHRRGAREPRSSRRPRPATTPATSP